MALVYLLIFLARQQLHVQLFIRTVRDLAQITMRIICITTLIMIPAMLVRHLIALEQADQFLMFCMLQQIMDIM